jgi:hypothetical protein
MVVLGTAVCETGEPLVAPKRSGEDEGWRKGQGGALVRKMGQGEEDSLKYRQDVL